MPPPTDAYSAGNILPDQKRGAPQIHLPEWVELLDSDQHFPLQEDIQGAVVPLAQSGSFTP